MPSSSKLPVQTFLLLGLEPFSPLPAAAALDADADEAARPATNLDLDPLAPSVADPRADTDTDLDPYPRSPRRTPRWAPDLTPSSIHPPHSPPS